MNKNSQKGVSLIITFFVAILILFIVLSISTLLYSQVKVMRNIGNSVLAFYTAESGIEKVLYYDRKSIPDEAERGVCNITNSVNGCPSGSPGVFNCDVTYGPAGLGCETCADNCIIEFSTDFGDGKRRYDVEIEVSLDPSDETVSLFKLRVFGTYGNVQRAMESVSRRVLGED